MTAHFSPSSFIAGIILGALLAGAWFFGGNLASIPAWSKESAAPSAEERAPESSVVSVIDQKAGSEVLVASVTAPSPGVWLAVREMNGGVLGNVLGAARVMSPRTNVSIPLLRATEPNRSYALELYRDDNNGAFDPALNSAYVDFDTSARVVVYFKTVE